MQSRQIGIAVAAVVGAFVIAFGIGKVLSGDGEATASGAKATVIKSSNASITAKAGSPSLPALKSAAKKKKAKKTTTTSTSTSTSTATATAPVTTTTRPAATTNTQTTTKKKSTSSGPVSTGGGED